MLHLDMAHAAIYRAYCNFYRAHLNPQVTPRCKLGFMVRILEGREICRIIGNDRESKALGATASRIESSDAATRAQHNLLPSPGGTIVVKPHRKRLIAVLIRMEVDERERIIRALISCDAAFLHESPEA
jgi:hypothetical protein